MAVPSLPLLALAQPQHHPLPQPRILTPDTVPLGNPLVILPSHYHTNPPGDVDKVAAALKALLKQTPSQGFPIFLALEPNATAPLLPEGAADRVLMLQLPYRMVRFFF